MLVTSLLVAGLAAIAQAVTIPVQVGANGLTFTPNDIKANVGDFVEFSFFPKVCLHHLFIATSSDPHHLVPSSPCPHPSTSSSQHPHHLTTSQKRSPTRQEHRTCHAPTNHNRIRRIASIDGCTTTRRPTPTSTSAP